MKNSLLPKVELFLWFFFFTDSWLILSHVLLGWVCHVNMQVGSPKRVHVKVGLVSSSQTVGSLMTHTHTHTPGWWGWLEIFYVDVYWMSHWIICKFQNVSIVISLLKRVVKWTCHWNWANWCKVFCLFLKRSAKLLQFFLQKKDRHQNVNKIWQILKIYGKLGKSWKIKKWNDKFWFKSNGKIRKSADSSFFRSIMIIFNFLKKG